MEKNKKIILIISVVVVILLLAFSIFLIVNKMQKKDSDKEKYYQKLEQDLEKDFKELYSTIIKPDNADELNITYTLGDLKRHNVNVDKYMSYDKKTPCNYAFTKTIRTVKDGKEKFEIYYVCGEDANYDYIG